MNKFKIIIIILLTFFMPVIGAAETDIAMPFDSLDFSSIRDPFRSQLPQKKAHVIDEVGTIPDAGNTDQQETGEVVLAIPTIVENIEEINLPEVSISGVVWNTNRPQAIINGTVVNVGDQLTEITIVAIQKEQINVRYQGIDFTIIP